MIQNREALINAREDAAKKLGSYDCRILVCSGTGCIATGSEKIYEKQRKSKKMRYKLRFQHFDL